jgi:hypothetical protein
VPFILISFLIPLFVFSPIFFIYKKNKDEMEFILYLYILAIIGIFLVKGTKEPLGVVNIWLYKHIPFLGTAFRANIQKWGLLLSFSFAPLLGLGINTISDYLKIKFSKKISPIVVASVIFLLFFIYAFPFWNGQLIFAGGGLIPSARIKIPSYYCTFKYWTKNSINEWRIFSFPLSRNSNAIYKWKNNGYAGGDIIRWFSNKAVIYVNCGELYQLPILIANVVEKNTNIQLEGLFSLLNVKYLLVHYDTNWNVIKDHSWWINHSLNKIEQAVKNQKAIKFNKKFGKLCLYKISDKYFLPHIYSSVTPTIVDADIETLSPMTETKYLDGKPVMVFTQQNQKSNIKYQKLKDINNFVFKDSNWKDLAIQFSQLDSWLVSELVRKIKIKKAGVYEIWIENRNYQRITNESTNYESNTNVRIEIKVDGREIADSSWLVADSKNRKYVKIGEVEIGGGTSTNNESLTNGRIKEGRGEHEIQYSVVSSQYLGENKKINIVLVSKEEREKLEKEIWEKINNPQTEVCYIFEKEKGEFYVP